MENDRARQFEEMRQRIRRIEREAAEGGKDDEARAEEARGFADRYEREANEVEKTDPELAAELRHDADLYRGVARDSDEASALAQEMAEDAEPFGADAEREEGGEG